MKSEIVEEIADKVIMKQIQKSLKDKGYTIPQVAEKLDYSERHVCMIFNGKLRPSPKFKRRLQTFLDSLK